MFGTRFTYLLCNIDKILCTLAAAFSLFIILYAATRKFGLNRRGRKLAVIEKNLRELAEKRPGDVKDVCPRIIGTANENEILNILYDKNAIFPEGRGSELRQCLVDSGKLAMLEGIASDPGDKWRRIQAIIAIGYAAGPKAAAILAQGVDDPDEDVAYFSMVAAAHIKTAEANKVVLRCLQKGRIDGHRVISLLETLPPEMAEEAVALTYDPRVSVRFWVVKLLGRINSQGSIPRIIELVDDESAEVRAAACEALGALRAVTAIEAIKGRLKDTAWYVRMRAANVLCRLMGNTCVPELTPLLDDEFWLVRERVREALKEF